MKNSFKRSFIKDLNKIGQKEIKNRIETFLLKAEFASSIENLPHTIKMKGTVNAYRTRIGNYRIGFLYDKSINELIFVRCVKRIDIYNLFP